MLAANWSIMGMANRSPWATKVGVWLSSGCALFLAVLGGIELYAAIVMGDFCEDPTPDALGAIPLGDAKTYAEFFSTCVGKSPVSSQVASVTAGVDTVHALAGAYLNGACAGNAGLLQVQSNLVSLNATVGRISNEASCPPIEAQWNNVLDSVCSQGGSGILGLAATSLLTSGLLFVGSFFAVGLSPAFRAARDQPLLEVRF